MCAPSCTACKMRPSAKFDHAPTPTPTLMTRHAHRKRAVTLIKEADDLLRFAQQTLVEDRAERYRTEAAQIAAVAHVHTLLSIPQEGSE